MAVDTNHPAHASRVRRIRESFLEANGRLVARLRGAERAAAERQAPDGGWSAAQIGWHVARVTSGFAAVVAGEAPGAPLPPGFVERDWAAIAAAIPGKLQAPKPAVPPARVTRDEAVAALEASAVRLAAALDGLTPERAATTGLEHALVGGTISLYQVGEWATAHVIRHNRQARRVLGG